MPPQISEFSGGGARDVEELPPFAETSLGFRVRLPGGRPRPRLGTAGARVIAAAGDRTIPADGASGWATAVAAGIRHWGQALEKTWFLGFVWSRAVATPRLNGCTAAGSDRAISGTGRT